MNFAVEPARDSDADAIADILSDWIDETDWMPRIHTRAEDRGFGHFLLDKTSVTVARRGGQVLGFLARQGEVVHALYIVGAARRQGVGQALLDAVKQRADRLELWTFQANEPAQAFYRAQGFAEAERTDGSGNDEKLPDLRMVWQAGRMT